jgi:CBS domain containing-hemolysin-like protein
MTPVLLLGLAGLLVVACGVFVAAEFAFITVNRASVEAAASEGDKKSEGVATALRSLSTQLSGAQLGITITNLAIGFLAEPSIAVLILPLLLHLGVPAASVGAASITVSLVVATATTMLFGELLPKNLAIARPMATARAVQGLHRAFTAGMAWPIRFTNGVANRILGKLGVEPQEELASARSAEELTALVRHSAKQGTLARETAELMERSLAFGERYARDAMTPRPQLISVPMEATVAEFIALAKETGHSRFPVSGGVQGGDVQIIGVIEVRAALRIPFEKRALTPVTSILTEANFVPDSIPLDDLMDDLRASGRHMALLVDEFGSLVGLVTFEDLVEEIVGDVRDEHDYEEDPVHASDGSWDLSGLMRVDSVNELTGLRIPESDAYDTIGGLVTFELGRLGEVGDTVLVEEEPTGGDDPRTVEIVVTEVDGHRVDAVHLRLVSFEGVPDVEDEP